MTQMVNVNKLRGKLVERGINVTELAQHIGLNPATLYRKLNGGGEKILIGEAQRISAELGLNMGDVVRIFFAGYVARCDKEEAKKHDA